MRASLYFRLAYCSYYFFRGMTTHFNKNSLYGMYFVDRATEILTCTYAILQKKNPASYFDCASVKCS